MPPIGWCSSTPCQGGKKSSSHCFFRASESMSCGLIVILHRHDLRGRLVSTPPPLRQRGERATLAPTWQPHEVSTHPSLRQRGEPAESEVAPEVVEVSTHPSLRQRGEH